MKLKLISDLHLNLLDDDGVKKSKQLNSDNYDVLVIAGDISENNLYSYHLNIIAAYIDKPIILVSGNHDLWTSTSYEQGIDTIKEVCSKHSHIHFLENDSVTIQGQKFVGSTLWFDYKPVSYDYKWSDIKNAPWLMENVRHVNQTTVEYLIENVKEGDVVVTHHLPSQRSINQMYERESTNRFYFTGCDFLIKDNKPKYWFHGHTHTACDYQLFDTNVVCNPLGYYFERQPVYSNGKIIVI